MNPSINCDFESMAALSAQWSGIEACLRRRRAVLTDDEYARALDELEAGRELMAECRTINELSVAVARRFTPFYRDAARCLERIHEIAGYGTLASCLSSLNIAEALFELGHCDEAGVAGPNLVIGRGHIAPLFYACRHLRQGMPLALLATVHEPVPAVVNKAYGFAYGMRHSLGEGVGIALGRAITHPDERVLCVAGDGELNEGVSCEAIRLVGELAVSNLTLVVDNNGRGIDPLPGKLRPGYLAAYFDRVYEVDGHDTRGIAECIREAERSRHSAAIVCHTRKGAHSFKRPGQPAQPAHVAAGKAGSCSLTAGLIEEVRDGRPVHVFTADLAARFGLKPADAYCNVGLAESALLTAAIGCPEAALKFVLTDDKYYLNAIDVLHSALIACRNLHVIAARKNGVWGGPTYVSTVFGLLTEETVYELSDPLDLRDCIRRRLAAGGNGLYLMYDQPMERILALRENYRRLSDEFYAYQPEYAGGTVILSSEAMAYEAFQVAKAKRCAHVRALSTRPDLAPVRRLLLNADEVIVAEHNGARFNLAEYVESSLLIRVRKVFSDAYEWPTLETFQSAAAPRQLDALLARPSFALADQPLRV
ncbi:1-deoxy-D-xylulose-5-phosphate synthase N-terminal domain-containing protein [Chromobacterium sp. ATCC 53434]|uniref:1-deoxy-D-xylulose-5-phosphate synthase N-terminal domain-containing protein n=1 Tax=Chromobacterium sp. (strain ATCC 53434 / SC 14030) TaxID=2059672 RepID=UPI001F469669|nr:1-deoxy-D-xylulose-5-phosphate synthase N-terminal domain-containing protein [Chromobacterium sp. ATCC 53434]